MRDVLASIREVVDNATLGVTIVGAVTLVGGVLILVGAVAMTKFQRLYEAAIYRTLGASTRMLAAMVAIEYGLLGLLAGALGAAGALVLSWALATWLFEIDWQPAPGLLAVRRRASRRVAVGAVGAARERSTCSCGSRWARSAASRHRPDARIRQFESRDRRCVRAGCSA